MATARICRSSAKLAASALMLELAYLAYCVVKTLNSPDKVNFVMKDYDKGI
jgi:hypothetical protein